MHLQMQGQRVAACFYNEEGDSRYARIERRSRPALVEVMKVAIRRGSYYWVLASHLHNASRGLVERGVYMQHRIARCTHGVIRKDARFKAASEAQ